MNVKMMKVQEYYKKFLGKKVRISYFYKRKLCQDEGFITKVFSKKIEIAVWWNGEYIFYLSISSIQSIEEIPNDEPEIKYLDNPTVIETSEKEFDESDEFFR
jgi:hypothetical protein